ncbi:MAG: chemotaxis protein CheA, partial [Pseudomonadota bacterium]
SEDIDEAASNALIAELSTWVASENDNAEEAAEIDFQPMTLDLSLDLGDSSSTPIDLPPLDLPPLEDLSNGAPASTVPTDTATCLKVTFRAEPELYESGNEPLFLIRALDDLGPCEIRTDFASPNSPDELKSLGGRLTWHISIETASSVAAVLEIFEFAQGLCLLEVGESAVSKDVGTRDDGPQPQPPETKDNDAPPPEPVAPPPVSEEPKPSAPPASTAAKPKQPKAAAPKVSPTVRVDLERIERLVNLVGELVINQAMLSQSIAEEDIPPNSPVSTGLDEFMQLTRNIQESVMMIRAQPVKSLFQRMSRIVREASAAVNKSVKFVTEGEATEIDKTAIENLADPLTHMIRNAVDHGLESSEDRVAAGKPKQGQICLAAAHKSGRVIIEVSDDGGGINREKVRSIAMNKGLIPEDAVLTESEIDQLLFLPGFSTADEVSALSGRGVGMDVVRTQITSLGGRVTIESNPGVGTKFSISLPLTLAVLDGMVVTVAGETLVVPLNAIVETLSLTADDLCPVSPGQVVLSVRDKFVPVIDLGKELGYREKPAVENGTIALLISPEEGMLVAMLVDTIEDQRQVVIKGLQESYGRVHGVAAATILGNGKIALILDTNDLVQNASGVGLETSERKAS